MRLRVFFVLGALTAVGIAAARGVPAYAPAAAADSRPLSHAQRLERRFLQISAGNLRFQAEASRLAAARSNNPAIRELAGTLLSRQESAQPGMLRLLHARDMALPITSPHHAKVLRQLAKLNGAKFDRLYADEVVMRSYEADIANYEKVAALAADPVLKAWVEGQLPTLRLHADKAGKALPAAVLRGQRAV